jgi:hypothetical protein
MDVKVVTGCYGEGKKKQSALVSLQRHYVKDVCVCV